VAVLGPTNTGKTHLAVERMLGHASGMIGLPLRLLAREIYDRIVKARGVRSVALITGEEKIIPPRAAYFVCTVEAMPLSREVEFLAIDEIQLAADRDRGHVFTDRLLNMRGSAETHETSSPSMDISKASNFERFVFDLLGRNGARVKDLFGAALARDGGFTLSAAEFAPAAGFGFVSGRSTHADRLATIRRTWQDHCVLVDTHTADGLKVALEHLQPGVPMLVLETALPAKFSEIIEEALGRPAPVPLGLENLESLPQKVTVLPCEVASVRAYIAEHASL
jgi:hypothetical protein